MLLAWLSSCGTRHHHEPTWPGHLHPPAAPPVLPAGLGGRCSSVLPAPGSVPAIPGGFSSPTTPSPISQSCVPPSSARAGLVLSSFSSLSPSLNALCLLWRRGAGRAPLPPRCRGSPRQMGPGYECAHSEAPKRICWCPFHGEPLCAAPLRWDAPRVLPRLLSLPLQKKRKCL